MLAFLLSLLISKRRASKRSAIFSFEQDEDKIDDKTEMDASVIILEDDQRTNLYSSSNFSVSGTLSPYHAQDNVSPSHRFRRDTQTTENGANDRLILTEADLKRHRSN